MTNQQKSELAWSHLLAGRRAAAEALFNEVLAADANHPRALHGQGLLNLGKRPDLAADFLGRSIRCDPRSGEAHFHFAVAQRAQGRLDDAVRSLRTAATLCPTVARYRAALGTLLQERGQLSQAVPEFQRATELDPHDAHALVNLSGALSAMNDPIGAEASARRALAVNPSLVLAHLNLGHALEALGDVNGAIAACRSALAIDPNDPDAHLNLGTLLLLAGDFEEGWGHFDYRFKTRFDPVPAPNFRTPAWDGSDLGGRTLLVYSEQGLGDTIQFARYIPMLAQRKIHVLLRCQPALVALMKSLAGVAALADPAAPLPHFDAHVPLLSLPRIMRTSVESIPRGAPYLTADSENTAVWRERLGGLGRGLRVGITWAGNPQHPRDHSRSLAPSALAPLAGVEGVQWISLQKLRRTAPPPLPLHDFTGELHDFSDTAALVANLDLVISVDTAAAHLAGALGRPVWTLLPLAPDWRWMLRRSDSPWYPTMRLWRQTTLHRWEDVIDQVAQDLTQLAKGAPSS